MPEVSFEAPEEDIAPEIPRVALWRVLVEPYEVPTKIGSIELPDEVRQNAGILMTVGKVVQMGDLAFKSKTKSGMSLNDCGVASSIGVGTWVLYGKYGGQQIHLRDGRKFVVLNDDQIIGPVTDPAAYQYYV